jgi:hypothetical protein
VSRFFRSETISFARVSDLNFLYRVSSSSDSHGILVGPHTDLLALYCGVFYGVMTSILVVLPIH